MSWPNLVDPMHISDVLEEWMEPELPGAAPSQQAIVNAVAFFMSTTREDQ